MKTSLFAFSAIALTLVTSTALAEKIHYTATLSGAAEVPPVTTAATGSAKFTFDTVSKRFCGDVTYTGLSGAPTAAHIHAGPIGVNSSNAYISFDVSAGTSPITHDELLDDAQAGDLNPPDAGVDPTSYVNIHTNAHVDGEIRGALVADSTGTDECPEPFDAGADTDGGGSSSSSSSSGSSGSSGATTTRADSGTDTSSSSSSSSCSTSPGSSSSPIVLAMGVGAAIALASRKRKKH